MPIIDITLLKEWHPTKNIPYTPDDYSPKTSRKAWWKCQYGHEWEARVAHRSNGVGCPYCSGRLATAERNLAVLHPEVSDEWDFDKNQNIYPHEYLPKSETIMWWKCNHGHSWQAKNRDRTKGDGCPFCSGRRVSDKNNLFVKRPDIASQWHPTKNADYKPQEFTAGSGFVAWWKCEKGHEWQAQIVERKRSSCPYCAGKSIGYGNDLASTHPQIAEEWHPDNNSVKPSEITPGSDYVALWRCKKGHEWKATIGNRTRGTGCPFCKPHKSKKELKIYSELEALFGAELGKKIAGSEADIYLPSMDIAIEYDGVYWHKNKIESDNRKNRVFNNNGVKLLRVRESGLNKIEDYDIIIDNNVSDLEMMHLIVDALVLLCPSSEKITESYKSENRLIANEMYFELSSMVRTNNNNPIDSEVLISEWHPEKNGALIPSDFAKFSPEKVWWQCKYGHEWQAPVSNRTQGNGCPYCCNQIVGFGNDLESISPELAKEWHPTKNNGLLPNMVTPKSPKSAWWMCCEGHEWKTTIYLSSTNLRLSCRV
jgi:hypothetical protein